MASKKKKIATNIPADILREATKLSGLNQTAAITEGLRELVRREKRLKLIALEGKLPIEIDLSRSRERR